MTSKDQGIRESENNRSISTSDQNSNNSGEAASSTYITTESFSSKDEKSKWKRALDILFVRTEMADDYAVRRGDLDLKTREEDIRKKMAETKNIHADSSVKIEEARKQKLDTMLRLFESDSYREASPEQKKMMLEFIKLDEQRIERGIDINVIDAKISFQQDE